MNSDIASKAIEAVLKGSPSYCKFLSANDSGETGGHQSGILISKSAKAMFWTDDELRENHILKNMVEFAGRIIMIPTAHSLGMRVRMNYG